MIITPVHCAVCAAPWYLLAEIR